MIKQSFISRARNKFRHLIIFIPHIRRHRRAHRVQNQISAVTEKEWVKYSNELISLAGCRLPLGKHSLCTTELIMLERLRFSVYSDFIQFGIKISNWKIYICQHRQSRRLCGAMAHAWALRFTCFRFIYHYESTYSWNTNVASNSDLYVCTGSFLPIWKENTNIEHIEIKLFHSSSASQNKRSILEKSNFNFALPGSSRTVHREHHIAWKKWAMCAASLHVFNKLDFVQFSCANYLGECLLMMTLRSGWQNNSKCCVGCRVDGNESLAIWAFNVLLNLAQSSHNENHVEIERSPPQRVGDAPLLIKNWFHRSIKILITFMICDVASTRRTERTMKEWENNSILH